MSTICPWPLRRAWKTAIRSPLAPWIAVQPSASGTVTGIGARSGKPVVNCTPEKAWAMRSSPRSPASGPVWPNGEMRRTARRGFRASSAAGDRPAASRRPGPQVLDQRVGGGQQRAEPRLGRQVGRLGLHRELAAVLGLEVERVLSRQAGAAPPHRRAGGRLDLDHGGAEVGEQPARQLAGQRPAPAPARAGPRARRRAGSRAASRRSWAASPRAPHPSPKTRAALW